MVTTNINGIGIYHQEFGAGDEAVFFLNGIMMTVGAWRPQTEYFGRFYRCICHDFRGQTMSEKPKQSFTFEDHADDLIALMDKLGIEKAHLVGTSYGGAVAIVFANKYPDRVKSLSCLSAMMKSNAHIHAMFEGWQAIAANAPETLFAATLSDNYSATFLENNGSLIDKYEQWYQSICDQDYIDALITMAANVANQDITKHCETLNCPTLILTGTEDIMTRPRCAQALHQTIKNSELVLVPDAGHAITVEKPKTVNSIVHGFIDDNT